MLSSTFYDKLDPQYRQKLLEIEKKTYYFENFKHLFSDDDEQIFHDDILDFFSQYMMPKELWDLSLKLIHDYSSDKIYPLKAAQYQFKYKLSASRYHSGKKLYNDITSIKFHDISDVEDLCYPHIDMDNSLEDYERNQYSFVPKSVYQTFERMKLQYDKIKAVEEDEEKWLEAILEVDNEEFIEHNIEFRIGQDLTNKKLWKFYLEYLKSHDQQKLFQAYSKYCRFFLDDTEMLEEYKNAAGKQKVCVPWRNAFDFEDYDGRFYHRRYEYKNCSVAEKAPLKCHFNAKNASNQRFPFRLNLMNYILKNANACVLHDLFKSCKWFYLKNPVTICYKFEAKNFGHNEIEDQFITVSDRSSFSPLLEKLFIFTYLSIESFSGSNNLIPRIYRCTAKFVVLRCQTFTDKELQILIGHGNVVDLCFDTVKNSNNEYYNLENILEMVPKIKLIKIFGIQCTSETSQKLCELAFGNKMAKITLFNIQNDSLEPKAFAEFINKNASPKADVYIDFHSKILGSFVCNFCSVVEAAIDEYWHAEIKPIFSNMLASSLLFDSANSDNY